MKNATMAVQTLTSPTEACPRDRLPLRKATPNGIKNASASNPMSGNRTRSGESAVGRLLAGGYGALGFHVRNDPAGSRVMQVVARAGYDSTVV